MTISTSSATWEGGLKTGKGQFTAKSGAFQGAYTFPTRFEGAEGTNPEELLAAAHAACLSMALAGGLEKAGHHPTRITTTASAHMEKVAEGVKTRPPLRPRPKGPKKGARSRLPLKATSRWNSRPGWRADMAKPHPQTAYRGTGLGKRDFFTRFAKGASRSAGQPLAFILAAAIIIVWAVTGPLFNWSDTWQLVINTGTTVVTFLMVFLIQNTQNRDSLAIHLKLDELIRSHKGAHTALLDLEELSTAELDRFQQLYLEMADKARQQLREGGDDTDVPRVAIQE
jgi:low affinity Fe/Cu permease/organic hydroperoxide reductase OsmC/OhrA